LAKATAQAKADAERIVSEAQVIIAEERSKAKRIQTQAELNKRESLRTLQIEHEENLANLDIDRSKKLNDIELNKFE